ncbi:MAG TPA: BMP family ABC transporter substrate-binding protein [Acidimicrobiia bacterium]|jgi:simple sugar transport system substrate-binding protein
MRLERWRNWIAALSVLALVGAACGGDGEATTTAGDAATTTTTGDTTTTTAGEATTTTAGEETTTTGEATTTIPEDFKIGMILVGPQNDTGWSQAHYEAGLYVMEQLGLPAENMIVLDKVNTADRPETSIPAVVDDMLSQGAQLIFATSDDMKDGILEAAAANPDVPMIWSSGDNAWTDGEDYRADLSNLGNVMGQMEFGKMIAGCSAALTTETGSIAYLGPLINDETRRLVNSAYLGARYCWEFFRGNDPVDLAFQVKWIGFWFNIPGFTLDPTQVTNEFLADGADVVISGIDTTEALVRAGQAVDSGESVWAVPYDYGLACDTAPSACLGVPYFNWGPAYVEVVQSVIDGDFAAEFSWVGPDWDDINDIDSSAVGWLDGPALSDDAAGTLADFIDGLGSGVIDLWQGPLTYQDGTEYVAEGARATDVQIWYTKQLLEGIEGASS